MAKRKPSNPKRAPAKRRSKPKIERVARTSPDLIAEQIARLRELFPEAVAEGKVEWERLRATLGEIADDQPERYSFTWTGKQDAIRVIQTPSRAALIPCPEESVNWEETQHLFIEGENLEVLKLLYKAYFGRVKMIYIDPPYNTGNDFVYRDNYTDPLDTYLKLTGQRDAEGNMLTSNPQTSGRYHSAWLSMMYPRLFLARQLLRDDGVVFVSIDDNEVHNLRMLMNEVFGEENLIEQIVWKKKYGSGALTRGLASVHEYVLCYSRASVRNVEVPLSPAEIRQYKGRDAKFATRGGYVTQPLATTSKDDRPNLRYPIIYEGREIWPEKQWVWQKDRFEEARRNDEVVFNEQDGEVSVRVKQYLRNEDGTMRRAKPVSVLNGPFTQEGTKELRELFGASVFDFPKPSALVRYLVSFVINSVPDCSGIYLDFFAGSATLGHAVLALNRLDGGNRRFALVQLPEMLETPIALSDGTNLRTIADTGKERIRRVIGQMHGEDAARLDLPTRETTEDLGFRVYKLTESSFRQWSPPEGDRPEELARRVELFEDPLVEGWTPENVIAEVALKEAGFGLNYQASQVESITTNAVWEVRDPDREQRFLICLDEALENETIRALALSRDDLFICRDSALNDTLAANLATQCRLKAL